MCKFSYCEPCRQVMPPRSEHCEFCKKCILRVDHHCIWMGNSCIGLLNHKFFILYLIYLSFGCLSISLLFSKAIFLDDNFGLINLMARSMHEAVVWLTACALLLAVLVMTIFQIIMMFKNKTTFELNLSATKTPFKHDHPVKNIQMVFGMEKRYWLSPFHSAFPNIKKSGIGSSDPSQRQITSMNSLVGGKAPSGIEYI